MNFQEQAITIHQVSQKLDVPKPNSQVLGKGVRRHLSPSKNQRPAETLRPGTCRCHQGDKTTAIPASC